MCGEIVTDLEGSPYVISAIEEVEITTGDGFGVGTTWRETRTMFGRSTTEEMTVAAVDPGKSYVVTSRAGGADYRSVLSVEPDSEGCTLSMEFTAEPSGTVSKVFASTVGKLFESGTRKALEQDLADIAAAAEAG